MSENNDVDRAINEALKAKLLAQAQAIVSRGKEAIMKRGRWINIRQEQVDTLKSIVKKAYDAYEASDIDTLHALAEKLIAVTASDSGTPVKRRWKSDHTLSWDTPIPLNTTMREVAEMAHREGEENGD